MNVSSWFGFGGSFCAVLDVVADWAAVASTHQAQSSFRSLSSLRESLSSKKNPAQLKKNRLNFSRARAENSEPRNFVSGNLENRKERIILKFSAQKRLYFQEDSIIG